MKFAIVVPWHNPKQLSAFKNAWDIEKLMPDFVFLQQDTTKAGCAQTKNAGIKRALEDGADYVVVLDDDCYPAPPVMGQPGYGYSLEDFAMAHIRALKPQKVRAVYPTCIPRPRGMPYRNEHIVRPVAASIGLWTNNLDLDAISTLVHGERAAPEQYAHFPFYHNFFPFSGMNFAFTKDWAECAVLIDVPRFDDIWMGWIWEKVAYEKGYCFNLGGPMINHSRQSDVWQNFEQEAKYLKVNEDLWSTIYTAPAGLSAADLRKMFFESPKNPGAGPLGPTGCSGPICCSGISETQAAFAPTLVALDSPHQKQNQQDDQNQSEKSVGAIPATVSSGGECSGEQKN